MTIFHRLSFQGIVGEGRGEGRMEGSVCDCPSSSVWEELGKGKAGKVRTSLSARLFRLSRRSAFIVAVVFLGREVSGWFPIVHINVAVLLLVFFIYLFFLSQVWASW